MSTAETTTKDSSIAERPDDSTVPPVARSKPQKAASTNADPSLAAASAMKDCKAHYANCRLDYAAWDQAARWDAVAVGKGGAYAEFNAMSLEQAKSEAIAGCKRRTAKPDSCQVKWSSHSPERLAVVESKTRSGYAVGKTRDTAISLAMKACQRDKNEQCGDVSTFENDGAVEEPEALKRIKIDIEQEKKKVSRDASQSNLSVGKLLRYSESCHTTNYYCSGSVSARDGTRLTISRCGDQRLNDTENS